MFTRFQSGDNVIGELNVIVLVSSLFGPSPEPAEESLNKADECECMPTRLW
eukprot:m.166730 g.166730  ORF g.166730 m.166730 type:complete len:51 (+) comp13456_c0_seq5:1082-1234(+)